MTDDLRSLIRSLTAIMNDETGLLRARRLGEVRELAAAKAKLTAQLERLIAELQRDHPNWCEQMLSAGEDLAMIGELQGAAGENGRMLQRQIELSRELLEAIAGEAKRLGGTSSETYVASGSMRRVELAAPISINASL